MTARQLSACRLLPVNYPVPVNLLMDRQSFFIAVILYGVSSLYSIFLLRQGFREDNRINYFLILGGFLFTTLAMIQRGFSLSRCPINNLFEATMFFVWSIGIVYLVFGIWSRVRFLGAFTSPVLFGMGVFALMPSLDPPHSGRPEFAGAWPSLHAALILLAYGAFGLSCASGAMYLMQERNLKFNKLRAALSRLPPIQRLESVTSGLTLGGFALLTAGLLIAPLILHRQQELIAYVRSDAKFLWSVFVWLLYFSLVSSRWRQRARHRLHRRKIEPFPSEGLRRLCGLVDEPEERKQWLDNRVQSHLSLGARRVRDPEAVRVAAATHSKSAQQIRDWPQHPLENVRRLARTHR